VDGDSDLDRRLTSSNATRKYQQLYEERLNPFKEFKRKQRQQRYKNLSAKDKITLTVGKFLFTKKHFRSFIFFYSLVLHALVFVTLWTHTINPHC